MRLLILLLFTMTQARTPNPCRGGANNALPHRYGCKRYIICYNFRPYVYTCPFKLFFDPDTNNCQPWISRKCINQRSRLRIPTAINTRKFHLRLSSGDPSTKIPNTTLNNLPSTVTATDAKPLSRHAQPTEHNIMITDQIPDKPSLSTFNSQSSQNRIPVTIVSITPKEHLLRETTTTENPLFDYLLPATIVPPLSSLKYSTESHTHTKEAIISTTDSFTSTTDSLSPTTDSITSTTDSTTSTTESVTSTTDSIASTTDSFTSTTDLITSTKNSITSTTDSIISTTGSITPTTDSIISKTDSIISKTDYITSATGSINLKPDSIASATGSINLKPDSIPYTTDSITSTTNSIASTTDYSTSTTDSIIPKTDSITPTADSITSTIDYITSKPDSTTSTRHSLTSNTPRLPHSLPKCNQNDSFLTPEKPSCNFFYYCNGGEISRYACPKDFKFHEENQSCQPAATVDCT